MQRGRWEQRGVVAGRAVRRLHPGVIALLLLAGCAAGGSGQTSGTAVSTATPDATAQAAATSTANAIATANQQDVLAFQTAQASLRAATATPTPVAVPTSTPAAQPSAAVAPTPTPYVIDFSRWSTGSIASPYPGRTTYDAATRRYTIALTDPAQGYVRQVFLPSSQVFQDFSMSVNVQQGGDQSGNGCYGIRFRVQAKGPNDQANAGFNLLVNPRSREFRLTWTDGNDHATVIGKGSSPAIKGPGAVNQLKVTCRGEKLTATINGQVVGNYAADHLGPGSLGLIVVNLPGGGNNTGMQASFSDLTIAELHA